jgi:hypothetical protein
MYLHVNCKMRGMIELKGNVTGKHTNAHTLLEVQFYYINGVFWALLANHTSMACFGPCWPIITACFGPCWPSCIQQSNIFIICSTQETHKIINV